MGGGLSYAASTSTPEQGQVFINGGGAYVPWIYDIGVHGNMRVMLLGRPDGVQLSTGVGAGTHERCRCSRSPLPCRWAPRSR
jgi:hypothetical protein